MNKLHPKQISVMNQHYQRFSFSYFLDAQERLSVEYVELWCGVPHVFLDSKRPLDAADIKAQLRARGVRASSVVCPSCSYQYQFAAAQPEFRQATFDYFQNGLRLAHDLACPIMTVNSGWGLCGQNREEAWKRSRDMLFALAQAARPLGVTLALESLKPCESNLVCTLADTQRMINEVGHDRLAVMVDTIAMGAAGETLADWFDAFGDKIVHMHFLDGDPNEHNIWGDGNFPLEDMIQCLNENQYQGCLVQEVADDKYFNDPVSADMRNLRILRRYI